MAANGAECDAPSSAVAEELIPAVADRVHSESYDSDTDTLPDSHGHTPILILQATPELLNFTFVNFLRPFEMLN